MLNITDAAQEQKIPPFFRLGFRPLFLSACLFSIIAVCFWIAFLAFQYDVAPYGGTYWWHAHEMVFGFVVPIIVGFLLTAVQTWTGVPGVRGNKLALLFFVWLIARVLLLFPPSGMSQELILIVDLLFLPSAAVLLAIPIVKVRQWRNLFFVPVLVLLTIMNLSYHLTVYPNFSYPQGMQHGSYGAIMLITLIMVVMGGRVIPFFTANATKIPKRPVIKFIEYVSLISTWVLALVYVLGFYQLSNISVVIGTFALFAGLGNGIRCARWRFSTTLDTPLLWSLHISYWFIPVSFILLSTHLFFGWFTFSNVLHGFTIGAMANLILAMIARVSLGHTGRPLKVKLAIKAAFVFIALAAFFRVFFLLMFPQYTVWAWGMSAGLWCIAFGLFVFVYWPILTKPRVDGRPG